MEVSLIRQAEGLSGLFINKPEISLQLSGDDHEFLAWGDPISNEKFRQGLQKHRSIDFIVNNLYGHYCFMFFDKRTQELLIGNSLFSILPLYYHINNERVIFSDNALSLGQYAGCTNLSKRFVLESVLFNYPLFSQSVIEGIYLLPSNSGILISSSGVKTIKHTSIEELFSSASLPRKRNGDRMADVFLDNVWKYLPDEHYFTSLTGGFDGRTLTAAGRYFGKSFSCYCFGTPDSRDLKTASSISSETGIPFVAINLDDNYIKEQSHDDGRSFIISSSGTGTFTRAHYLFASEQLKGKTRYIVTGNFGSEIFRAMHIPGVVISRNLFTIFKSANLQDACKAIRKSPEMNYLNQAEFCSELKELENDIAGLPCFSIKYKDLTRSMQFYIFVFEELFRKYFGAELVSQFGSIKNRTPFIDIDFLRELLTTEFAGIHSKFYEGNPLKRFRGQLLYAQIIRKAFPALGKMITEKGYRPDDLISVAGKFRILRSYTGKQLSRKDNSYDPNGVKAAWVLNQGFYNSLPVNADLFNKQVLLSGNAGLTDIKAKTYSLIYIDNYLNKL